MINGPLPIKIAAAVRLAGTAATAVGSGILTHGNKLLDGSYKADFIGTTWGGRLVTVGSHLRTIYSYGPEQVLDATGISGAAKKVAVWGGLIFAGSLTINFGGTVLWLATPITYPIGLVVGPLFSAIKSFGGHQFESAVQNGIVWGLKAIASGGVALAHQTAVGLKDASIQVLTQSTWQTWGMVGGIAAAYATYRFSGRIIDETISYYAAAAKEAISAPFSNIQMKKNIPLITPALNLAAKGYRQIFPADPKANPILSPKIQAQLDQIVTGMKNQKKNRGYFQNITLEGPPGTGKTMVAKKIAEDSGFNFIKMSGSDLAGYIAKGTHLSTLNWYMNYAKNSFHPTVLFIDEADVFMAKRETLGHGQKELLNQFLEHTGDPEFNKNVMIIMATNRAQYFDSAVDSRVDHRLHIGPPGRAQRAQIIQEHANIAFRGKPEIESDGVLNESGIAAIAARTNHLTGRALQKLVNSLLSVKSSTPDNKLTWDLVDNEIHRFVWKDRSSPDASRSWKMIEMVSDVWQFTLPWLCRRIFAIPGKVATRTWSIVSSRFA